MNYAIYDEDTSEILLSGSCDQSGAEAKVKEGQKLFDLGNVVEISSMHRIINGALVLLPSALDAEHLALSRALRLKRDGLLSASDWTQFNDVVMSDEKRIAWQVYRQELRDIVNDTLDGLTATTTVIWPAIPG